MPKLKRDVAPLLNTGISSMTLAIELFNRPSEVARQHAVLILLHHAFEMLLKAAIMQETGSINKDGDPHTYSFARCLTIGADDLELLDSDERATLKILDNQRDTAMHFYSDVSEDMLYVHIQSAVTLYNKVLRAAFNTHLSDYIPNRVLPVSAHPPTDLTLLLDRELLEVDELLTGKKRRGARAAAKLRSLLAFTTAIKDESQRMAEADLDSAITRRRKGDEWALILPEIAQLKMSSDGTGIPVSMRLIKQGEIPVRMASPGEVPVGTVVARDVNVWDKYSMSRDDLAKKLGISGPKTHALIYELKIQDDKDCYSTWTHKGGTLSGYSKKALDRLQTALTTVDLKEVWSRHKHRFGAGKKKKRR